MKYLPAEQRKKSFLSPGHKRWTEIKKYGKICIRNDVVKSEFVEDMSF